MQYIKLHITKLINIKEIIKNQGLNIPKVKKTFKSASGPSIMSNNVMGRIVSAVPISPENLLRILPKVVRSKKRTHARVIEVNI